MAATTLTFDAGQEEKTVTVQTTEDSAAENDETFTVTLSSPSNATIPDATAKGTIEDDDGTTLPTLSVGNASATEGADISFPLTLSAAASAAVTVTCTASIESGDTAVAADLATTTGTASIGIGATSGPCFIETVQDTIAEDNETFTVTLSGVSSNAQLATDPTAKGTIVDDDTAPTITGVSVTSTPVLATDTYGAGETIEVSVTFDEAVTATSDTDFELNVSDDKSAPLLRGSGTQTLVFGYTVAPGDEDDNGIWIGDQDRTLVGDRRLTTQAGAITSTATGTAADLTHTELGRQDNHKVDGTRSIVSVAVTSTPQLETDTYGAGETIEFTVTFNVAVDVTGDPVLEFLLDGSEVRQASDVSGSGTTTLVFSYTVVSGDDDDNGLFIRDESDYNNPDGPVRLDSNDEIEFKDTSTDVPLYWAGRGTQSGHKVDGSQTTDNVAPVFANDLVAITLPENSAVGTSVGAAVTATDADSDTLTYSLEGTDAASFDIESGTGQIKTKSGVTYDFEATQNTYEMTVKADDGNGGTDTIEVNIALLDADEKSAKPDKPELAKVRGSTTKLTATWPKPELNGGPDITGYKLQYKVSTETSWTDFPHSGTGVTATVTGLTADTFYQARVLAKNGETDSDWSDASDAVSTNAAAAACTPDTAAGDIWCGVLTVADLGGNTDGFSGNTGGLTDKTFSVGTNSYPIYQVSVDGPTATNPGELIFSLDRMPLDAADRARLVLHVDGSMDTFAFSAATQAASLYVWTGTGLDWSSETFVTLRLRLTPQPPGAPTNLMAEADGGMRIALSWDAPADDGGSAITGYRIEVSDDGGSNWSELEADTGDDGTGYTHEGLSPGDTRHYRVSAINAEGTSDASAVADATTAAAGTCTPDTAAGDIWCGVVTVEQFSIPPLPLYGFGAGKGGLSDPDFTYGSNSYTIDVAANELNNELLYFSLTGSLTAGDRAALELHVDGSSASFALSAATYNSSEHNYTWTGTGLNWFGTPTVTLRLRAATESDATLRALDVTYPGGSARLRPAFAPNETEYLASVANAVGEVRVVATATRADATVEYLDAGGTAIADVDTGTPGREVLLDVGDTVFKVKVTAEDTTTTRTYTVTVRRGGVDAPGTEGELRLTEEESYSDPDNNRHDGTAGRVEVYHAGAWGTVCSDGIRDSSFKTINYDPVTFAPVTVADANGNEMPTETAHDNEAAALICKDRGYDDGEYREKFSKYRPGEAKADHQDADYWPPNSSYPADGPKPIWIDDLRCVAGDSALMGDGALPGNMSHCNYAGWGLHNCTHKEDAVVQCWHDDAAGAENRSLQGRFVSPPERHDGTNRIKLRVAFSEPVEESPQDVGAHGVEVEGGAVTSVSPVGGDAPDGAGTRSIGNRNAGREDREVVWEFEIEPDSDGDVTVSIEAGRPCDEEGAICTADGRSLSEGISTTVEGPEEGPPPLTASFTGLPETHDGESGFTFRIAFSERVGWMNGRRLREDVVAVSGGRATAAGRVDRRRDLWQVTVEPDSGADVTVTLGAGAACRTPAAVCTSDGRALSATISATVAGPAVETGPAPLTASFVDMPDEHDGESAFTFRIAFSEPLSWMNGRRLRENVVAVSGGRATAAGRVDRRRDLWHLTVEPDSLADVTVTLGAGAACGTPAAVCTSDGRALSNSISTTVRGPVTVSVADARAEEGADETIDFAVTLSRAASGTVAVAYATADGTATAGADYTARKGELTFVPGETAKTVAVPVLDDAHDEGEETFTLRLTAATGARIADGIATGTIENADHMPQAWLARFGRTVTDQVLDAVEARLAAPRTPGAQATLAGQALPSWDGSGKAAANIGSQSGAGPGTGSGAGASERAPVGRDREAMTAIRDWMAHAGSDPARIGDDPEDRERSRALTGRDFLTGTSFALTGGSAEAGGYAALWGRGAISRFDGREGELSLDGEVTTGLIGADWASAPGSRRWTAGLAVGHARGTGSYREGGGCDANSAGTGADGDPGASRCAGEIEATLTGLWPYGGLQLTDRLSAWGALGYGAGEMKLMPGGNVSPFTADLTMAMGAAGLRGEVLTPPPEGGLALAVKGDMRFTRTASEATKDAADKGRLEAAEADVWLLRTGIEGSRRFVLGGDTEGMVLTPSFEIGARLDGGDAETGLGVDLGGGLAFAAPRQGVALDLKGRGLIAHEASGFREWGASAALTWDPRPETDRGLALRLRQSWGGSPTGGMDALLGRETLAGLAANDDGGTASAGRLEAELGYGIALFDGGFTGTPNLGVGFSETGRDYRVGWRLTSARRGDPGFQVDLDATRREAANTDAEHGLMLRGTIRW